MKKLFIFLIILGTSLSFANAQTLQEEEDVLIRAWVPEIGSQRTPPQAPKITEVEVINRTETSCTVFWKTDQPSRSYIDYGLTADYEMGTIYEEGLVKEHRINLSDLQKRITYHFKVRTRDLFGTEIVSEDLTFVLPDLTPPANVSNFSARAGNGMITLTWSNPQDEDFTGVRIQMSKEMYPAGPEEGTTVFDKKGTIWTVNDLENGVRYYFTAFAYDDYKNYASGSVASAVPSSGAPSFPSGGYISSELMPKISELKLEDFSFFIKGVQIFPEEGVLKVNPGDQLKISITPEKLPKVLKTILIIIGIAEEAKTSQSMNPGLVEVAFAKESAEVISSYLLRINPEETEYQAIVTVPEAPANYPLTIAIMDFKEGSVVKIGAILKVLTPEGVLTAKTQKGSEENIDWKPLIILISIILTIGALIGYSVGKKFKRKSV